MPKYIDITGKKFGHLTVIKRRPDLKKYKRAQWECRCDCGEIIFTFQDTLNRAIIKTCGRCLVNKNIGKKFGKLTILGFSSCRKRLTRVWCRCDCGNEKEFATTYVIRGISTNCGCLRRELDLNKAIKKIGCKFNRLKVIKINGKDKNGNTLLLCKCKCGNYTVVRSGNIKTIKSCGCLQPVSVPKGENVTIAKLRNFEAKSVRELYGSKSGYTPIKLAEMFHVDVSTIRRILKGQTYKERPHDQ